MLKLIQIYLKNLCNKFPSEISKESYIALSNFEKEKLIRNYYSDIKSRGSGKFDIFYFFLQSLFPVI